MKSLLKISQSDKKQLRNEFYGKIYYHISPEADIQQFRSSYSNAMRERGVFISSKYSSLINDWMGFVLGKKEGDFNNLTIYKLWISPETVEKCAQSMNEKYEDYKESGNVNFGFWAWGDQTFIPEEFVSEIKIISRKTYLRKELFAIYNNFSNKPVGKTWWSEDMDHPSNKFITEVKEKMYELGLKQKLTPEIKNDFKELISRIKKTFFVFNNDGYVPLVEPKDVPNKLNEFRVELNNLVEGCMNSSQEN